MNKAFVLIFILSMFVTAPAQTTEIDAGFDSRYVSEGRNQLITGGIYWMHISHDLNDQFSVGASYGYASQSEVKYDELNLALTYADSIEGFDYYVGYTRLEFLKDNESDDEFGLGLAYTEIEFLTPLANFVYSREADGFFISVGAEKEFIVNDHFTIVPYVLVSYDFGYAAFEDNGYNHTHLGTTISYALSENATIVGILEQSLGGSVVKEEVEEANQFWSGIHFVYSW